MKVADLIPSRLRQAKKGREIGPLFYVATLSLIVG